MASCKDCLHVDVEEAEKALKERENNVQLHKKNERNIIQRKIRKRMEVRLFKH